MILHDYRYIFNLISGNIYHYHEMHRITRDMARDHLQLFMKNGAIIKGMNKALLVAIPAHTIATIELIELEGRQ